MAKQFYLAQEVSGKIYDEGYHTHVTCPAFRDTVFPTEITEEQAQKTRSVGGVTKRTPPLLTKKCNHWKEKGGRNVSN